MPNYGAEKNPLVNNWKKEENRVIWTRKLVVFSSKRRFRSLLVTSPKQINVAANCDEKNHASPDKKIDPPFFSRENSPLREAFVFRQFRKLRPDFYMYTYVHISLLCSPDAFSKKIPIVQNMSRTTHGFRFISRTILFPRFIRELSDLSYCKTRVIQSTLYGVLRYDVSLCDVFSSCKQKTNLCKVPHSVGAVLWYVEKWLCVMKTSGIRDSQFRNRRFCIPTFEIFHSEMKDSEFRIEVPRYGILNLEIWDSDCWNNGILNFEKLNTEVRNSSARNSEFWRPGLLLNHAWCFYMASMILPLPHLRANWRRSLDCACCRLEVSLFRRKIIVTWFRFSPLESPSTIRHLLEKVCFLSLSLSRSSHQSTNTPIMTVSPVYLRLSR